MIFDNSSPNAFSQRDAPLKKLSSNAVPNVWKPEKKQASDSSNTSKIKIGNPTVGTDGSSSDIAFRLYQTKLQLNYNKQHLESQQLSNQQANSMFSKNEPIYYSPPSSIQPGIQGFLPPNVKNTQKQSTISRRHAYNVIDSVSDQIDENLEDATMSAPTGEWFNPVVKEALTRQVNKEDEFRKFAFNLMVVAILKYGLRFTKYVQSWYINLRKQYNPYAQYYSPGISSNSNSNASTNFEIYWSIFVNAIFCLLIYNIVISLYKLIKKQDECLDLPLSNKQRKMLGLQIIKSQEADEDERVSRSGNTASISTSTSFPKYMKARPYGTTTQLNHHTNSNNTNNDIIIQQNMVGNNNINNNNNNNINNNKNNNFNINDAINLSYSKPESNHRLLPKSRKPFNNDEVEKFSEKFKSKYSLEFDYSDEE